MEELISDYLALIFNFKSLVLWLCVFLFICSISTRL